jgi:hypothetical protein
LVAEGLDRGLDVEAALFCALARVMSDGAEETIEAESSTRVV